MCSNKIYSLCLALLLPALLMAQSNEYYLVEFKDKGCSEQLRAEEYLSAKALERRKAQGISLDFSDLPLCADYLQQVGNLADLKLKNRLKWINSATVEIASQEALTQLRQLSFVRNVKYIGSAEVSSSRSVEDKFKEENSFLGNYGETWPQVGMIATNQLHKAGYTGKGMTIAVLDAGFRSVDTLESFQHLWKNGQILGMRDFVNKTDSVFYNSSHGTSVLSTMALNDDARYIGTAPEANYYLLLTEDAQSEKLIEEYYWAEGAEFADSAGADIINSSLGYTRFDDASEDHSYEDLDGNTTPVTRAANRAYEKGILVVNSAGNYAQNGWFYMGAPSDGYGVLSVGAVGADQSIAPFSSRGPNSAGQVKPDVCAMGWNASVLTSLGSVVVSNGTSFSGPIIAGSCACLWQAYQERSNLDIMEAIRESAHQYESPDEEYGYGIPDFSLAMELMEKKRFPEADNNDLYENFLLYPNPTTASSNLEFVAGRTGEEVVLEVFSIMGSRVQMIEFTSVIGQNEVRIDCSNLTAGSYVVRLSVGDSNYEKQLVVGARP